MIQSLREVFILGILFLGTAFGLQAIDFWSLAGLPEPKGFIAQGVLFLTLFFVLRNFLFEPYLKLFDERAKETVGKKKEAESTQAQADEMIAKYQDTIRETRLKAIRERESRALEGEEQERARIAKAREEGESLYSSAYADLKRDQEKAEGELKSSLSSVTDDIVGRVLHFGEGQDAKNVTGGMSPQTNNS